MTGSDSVSKRSMQELVSSVGDGFSKTYATELQAVLQNLPIRVDQSALEAYRQDRISGAAHFTTTVAAASSSSMLSSPRRQVVVSQVGGGQLPLPSIIKEVEASPIPPYSPKRGMKHYPHSLDHVVPLSPEELEASARQLKIPRKHLATSYQARVSPRQDWTHEPHIFSGSSSHLRSGFTSIETKETKKFMLPNPPQALPRSQYNLVDVAGGPHAASPRSGPQGTITSSAAAAASAAYYHPPQQTFTSKIRETLLHTGHTIPSTEQRRIPPLKERFEASYAPLYLTKPHFDTRDA